MAGKGNRPGFAETFRYGWSPPQKRAGASGGGPAAKSAAAPQPPAGSKPSRPRKAGGRKNGGSPATSKGSAELVKRKDELSHQFAELQWDLGGIAYEMARRDHYRLEVLNAQASKLQQVDAELGQIERMLKLDEAGAAGSCPSCGALQARGAMFCWKCGKEVELPAAAPPKQAKAAKPKKAAKTSSSKAPAPKPKPKSSGTRILRRASRSSKAKRS